MLKSASAADVADIQHIITAADCLRRMVSELEVLDIENPRLHFAMSNTRQSIHQRLNMLTGISELLKGSVASERVPDLCQRAKRLVGQLGAELEELAIKAELEFEWA